MLLLRPAQTQDVTHVAYCYVLDSQNPMSAGLAGMPAGGYRRPAHIPRRRTLSATQWVQVNNLQLNKEKLPEIVDPAETPAEASITESAVEARDASAAFCSSIAF